MNGIIIPQNVDDYFPHAVGNTWQYQTMEGNFKTDIITKDSVDSDGNIFLNFDNQTGMFEWKYKITRNKDSIFISPTRRNDLEYTFPLEKGKEWIIYSDYESKYVGYVFDSYKVEVFGDSVDVFGVAYFGTTIDDTISWPGNYLAQPIRIMAKGFGVIEEYEETTYKILTGAVINGKTYGTIVSIETGKDILPSHIELYQNYPNPFNPSTVISWQLAESINVNLKVYDILGREIKTLVNTYQTAGKHEVLFDGSNLPSGIYIYRLSAGNISINKKMLLLK
jgi:hypothetical protein